MLRFKIPKLIGPPLPRPDWPDGIDRQAGVNYVPLFSPRPAYRKLRVMADVDILRRAVAQDAADIDDLLGGLLHHPYVTLFRYQDGGPPEDAFETHPSPMPGCPEGWIVGPPRAPQANQAGTLAVKFMQNGKGCIVGFPAGQLQHAREDEAHNPYTDMTAADAADQRVLDVAAAKSAAACGVDLFVTERFYLFAADWDAAGDLVVARPVDALPLVSLYLRAQGHFSIRRGYHSKQRGNINMRRGTFYLTATHQMLPGVWRWFEACEQHSAATGNDDLAFLAGSLFQRVQGALQARDRVLVALNGGQTSEDGDDALDALDQVLLLLMASVDVSASVAHAVLNIQIKPFLAKWQDDRFITALDPHAPTLADFFKNNNPHQRTLQILTCLRNSIHGSALAQLRLAETFRRESTWVELPARDVPLLRGAMNALGGQAAWGVTGSTADGYRADPGQLADKLIVRTVELLNAVLDETPVERLSGVVPGAGEPDPTHALLGVDGRRRVRLQLGI